MKTKNLFVIFVFFVFLLFAFDFLFADNIGRVVYGIYTETYNGIGINNIAAGNENVNVWAGGTFETITTDQFDGIKSYQIGNTGWVSFVFVNGAQDMSDYSGGRIYFSAKIGSEMSEYLNLVYIKIQDSTSLKQIPFNSSSIKRIDSDDTGILIDNDNWHTYYIELSNFIELDLHNITHPLLLSSDAPGTFLIDNIYWTKASSVARSFTVTVKNISDNEETENITWAQSAYRKSWIAAQQYIELDLDQESSNWYVRIYLSNKSIPSRIGLYCEDGGADIVLPMAWRVRPDLVSAGTFTLLIGKANNNKFYNLYDLEKNPTGDWYNWFPMRELSGGLDFDDVKVWNLSGIHTAVRYIDDNVRNYYDSLSDYYERKPKIYFAADCSNAVGGLTYTATVVTELVYE